MGHYWREGSIEGKDYRGTSKSLEVTCPFCPKPDENNRCKHGVHGIECYQCYPIIINPESSDEVISQMAADNVRLEKENKELREEVERLKLPTAVTEELLRNNDGYIHVGHGCELAIRGTTEKLHSLESKLKKAVDTLKKIISVIRTINHGKYHEIMVEDDDMPVLPQRKEWVEYVLEETKLAEEALSMLEGE
jgi:tRNA/tmRNA/rRNA uracil-C5-methylase (TrmA/RlmC/RlmD family)